MIYLHSTDPRQRALADDVDKAIRAELRKARKKARPKKPGKGIARSGTDVARWRRSAFMKIIGIGQETGPDLRRRGSAPSATRTRDLLLRRQLLYPLSYRG